MNYSKGGTEILQRYFMFFPHPVLFTHLRCVEAKRGHDRNQQAVIGGNGRVGGSTGTRRAGELRACLGLIRLSCPMSRRVG